MALESVGRTYTVALIIFSVCSLLVSGAAVGLHDKQQANKELDRRKNILIAAGIFDANVPIAETFQMVDTKIVDLATGEYVSSDVLDPATYDQRLARQDADLSIRIPRQEDLAGIGRREKYSFVYFINKDGKLDQIVLPIVGKGLWSTMYGFVALDADLHTIRGLSFYEHGETAGLGSEINNPSWQKLWVGKKVYDEQGAVDIRVIKGTVDPNNPTAIHQIDGLAGATLTGNGVTHLMHYWFGGHAFKPFLSRLGGKGATDG
jgi:Na+-transporting NADH:ubiquinone oxidoreductase subunit C